MYGLRERVEIQARRHGFARVRFADADALDMHGYDAFLDDGRHASMVWLASGRDEREQIARLLPGVKSVAVLQMDYAQPVPADPGGLTGRVASYAWGRDYHNMIGRRLRKMQRDLQAEVPGLRTYVGVDNRPLYERAWAARAGLGYAGKNACQIMPGEGSLFFLGIIALSEHVESDSPMSDHCGRCRRCIDACPTRAIIADGTVDARLCISYLTIEHDGPIPEELRPQLGRWIFGCDDCQTICPHQREGQVGAADFSPVNAWVELSQLVTMSDDEMKARFVGTPIRRAAGERLRRNAAIVLGNLGNPAAKDALERTWKAGGVAGEAAGWSLARL